MEERGDPTRQAAKGRDVAVSPGGTESPAGTWWLALPAAATELSLAPRPLTPLELDIRRAQDDAYHTSLPLLEDFGSLFGSRGQVVAYLDADGWMLALVGDAHAVERLAELHFSPGSNWAENRAGAPPVVEAPWHPPEAPGESWACVAARVRSRGGAKVATAAIAGPWAVGDCQALVTVRAIASALEERLQSSETVRDQVLEYALRAASAAGEGLLAADGKGRVIAANDAARRSLGFVGLDVPLAIRGALEVVLRDGGDIGQWGGEVVLPGSPDPKALRLLASRVRHGQSPVGMMVRVVGTSSLKGRASGRGAQPAPPAAVARYGFEHVRGESESIHRALALARMASRNDLPVVLVGESGTGKELFAQAIHSSGSRAGGPFIAVNCGCIPAALLEAELFGYQAGTFTGARKEGSAGKFEEAGGGTLFLDEVSELSAPAQAALLRVLQEREVVRLGGSSARPVDIRVIAASNKSLVDEIRAGRFRPDLFFRLNVLGIHVPPLRERRGDVALLANAFLREAESEVRHWGLELSDQALRALAAWDWPGNIRELRNVVLRAAANATSNVIGLEDLPEEIGGAASRTAPSAAPPVVLGRAPSALAEPDPDREALLRSLEASAWNIARTAQALHISRMTLYRRLHRHGIERWQGHSATLYRPGS